MEITRFKAKNYRTYVDLDIDLSVEEYQPIVLIGGANGGGKTTLFNAIHGALYGLHISTVDQFQREVNAGVLAAGESADNLIIELEIHFTGLVLGQQHRYILTRTWQLVNSDGGKQVRHAVVLNMNGNVTKFGSATPAKEKAMAEAAVSKIIKANLPKELSEYFLFDAMKSGEKLSDAQLSRIIRENIEIVMGFRKYLDLRKATERVKENKAAEQIKQKEQREEYVSLTTDRRNLIEKSDKLKDKKRQNREQIEALTELVEELSQSQDQESLLKGRRDRLVAQRDEIIAKEKSFSESLKQVTKEIAISVGLPQLARMINSEVNQILNRFNDSEEHGLTKENTTLVVESTLEILKPFIDSNAPTTDELVKQVIALNSSENDNPWDFLDQNEINALSNLVNTPKVNPFTTMDVLRGELEHTVPQLPQLEKQIEELEAQIAGKDYSPLKRHEELVQLEKQLEVEIDDIGTKVIALDKKLQRYDIQIQEEPDPKYETVCRLVQFFEDAADELLKAKKSRLEEQMKEDLNLNLAAYRGVIQRVELSENLRSLSFKIFHKAGNEIYLDQLNAASKQIVVQVLLKALHLYGDYDPPVMIDTVMGVLDKESRTSVLENYFPSLAHQTILLSTDSEIDPDRDLVKIAPHVSKSYTLKRDMEAQKTDIQNTYFGASVEDLQ